MEILSSIAQKLGLRFSFLNSEKTVSESSDSIENSNTIDKLKFNYQLLNQVINSSEDGIIVVSNSGSILYVNYQSIELFGLSESEMLTLRIQDIDDQRNDDYKWNRFVLKLEKQKTITSEYNFRNNEGIQIPIEEISQLIEFDNNKYISILFRDIEKRKSAEIEIKRDLEQKQLLSEISFLMNTSDDFDYKIRESLRIIGNYIETSRVFIFEDILNGKAVSNTYEWCKRGINSQRENLQAIPYSLMPEWIELMNSVGYIKANDLTVLPKSITSIFLPHQTLSILAFPLITENAYKGFIGISEAYKTHDWEPNTIELFNSIAHILSNAFELKLSINNLIKSELRFREFAELLPEMVFETGINGKLLFVNKQAIERIGITDESLAKGVIFFSLFSENDQLRIWDNVEKLIKQKHIANQEYNIISRDGFEFPVIAYINLIMREHLPAGLRIVMVDISDRKKSESQIVSLAKFGEESPYPILRVELNGNISYCNKAGIEVEEFVQQNFELYFKDMFNIICLTGQTEQLEINIHEKYFHLSLIPIKELKYVNIYGIDITQRKQNEENIQLSLRRFNDISEASNEFFWETDIFFKYTLITKKSISTIGYNPDEMIGQKPFEFVYMEDVEKTENLFEDNSRKCESFNNFECRINTKSGKINWVSISGIPFFDHNHRFLGFRGTCRNITH